MAKILLVEDDVSLRDVYAMRMQADGYDVVTASDGEEALASAVKEKPDLIILDVMMPKISGFDVLDIVRSTPETKHAKVIMMTALSQQSDRERGERLGADRYLVKSQVALEDVVNTVRELLGQGSASSAGQAIPINKEGPKMGPDNNDSTAPTGDVPAPAGDDAPVVAPAGDDAPVADAPAGDVGGGSPQPGETVSPAGDDDSAPAA